MLTIRTLSNKQIDRKLWDNCVANAKASLPYAYSWYLDAVAENWDGLVYGNYEAVMPMVWLRKYGIPCIYQPYYCQQLGVYSPRVINQTLSAAFLNTAAFSFPYIDINLNALHAANADEFGLLTKKNLLLHLNKPYSELRKTFSENHRRNIAKAEKAGLVFDMRTDMAALRRFYLASINREREKWFNAKAEGIFNKLMTVLAEHSKANIYTALCEEQIVAAMVIVPQGKRMISIINASDELGKAKGASHFLHGKVIEHLSASDYILDLEGSSIPSIARFYEGFGAQPETFYRWQTNILRRTAQRFM